MPSVYFIQAIVGGPIKIGYSANPAARLSCLQQGSPFELRILCTLVGTRADERGLHLRFAEATVGGEWFAPTPDLISLVESLGGKAFVARAWTANDAGPQRRAPIAASDAEASARFARVQIYVTDRLRQECAPRGQAAKIARSIGFAKPTISDVLAGKRRPGPSLVAALASRWGTTWGQLEQLVAAT